MSSPVFAVFRKVPEDWRDTAYWFVALLGILPAVRADLLLPHTWSGALGSTYSMPQVDNPFGLAALLLAYIAAGLAATSGLRWRFIAVAPYVAIVLAGLLGEQLPGLNSVFVGSAFLVFAVFLLRGEVMSLGFAAFVLMLVAWQSFDELLAWPQTLVFVAAVLVLRLVVEAFRQNAPLAKQLGRSNLLALTGRTFALWWPMLILIGIGLWGSSQITDATERLMYERGYVDRYCGAGNDDPAFATPCDEGQLALSANQVEEVPQFHPTDGSPPPDPICVRGPVGDRSSSLPPLETFRCPSDMDAEEWVLIPLDYFDNLDKTVQRRYAITRWRKDRAILGIDEAALRAAGTAESEARELFSIVPESTGMETSTCYFPDVACAAANIVIRGLNSAYDKGRDAAEDEFVEQMGDIADATLGKTKAFTEATDKALTAHLDTAERRTRQFIDRVHTASNLLRQVLLLWLVVVIIKSILYVFARVIFDKSTDIDIDLLDRESEPAEGRVADRQEINIPGSYPYDIFYKANYQPLGPAARFSIPQWRASAMSRLRFGAWNMSRVAMPLDDERGITFNSIEAEHLVDWELEEGEEVVFSYRNFVAMNSNIQLRTVISLRVATLLLGRIVFHTARCTGGPGRLILRTRGKPATAAQVRQSIPAARLVAWNRYAKFSVDSHLTCADIFLNGFNLRRGPAETEDGPQGILVVEADARDGGLLVGTLRFAKNFLLPV